MTKRLKSTALIETCFLSCMHRETSKFKQSVLTLVLPVSSSGIRQQHYNPDNDLIRGHETNCTRSASSDMRTFLPDMRMQTL